MSFYFWNHLYSKMIAEKWFQQWSLSEMSGNWNWTNIEQWQWWIFEAVNSIFMQHLFLMSSKNHRFMKKSYQDKISLIRDKEQLYYIFIVV